MDAIKSGVKGIKQEQINEFVVRAYRTTKMLINQIETLLPVRWRGSSVIGLAIMKAHRQNAFMEYINKNWNDIKEKLFQDINIIKENSQIYHQIINIIPRVDKALTIYHHYTIGGREGEERINKNVPLKSKYIQIRLLSTVNTLLTEKEKEELRSFIEKNKDVFVPDSTLGDFME